MTGCSRFSTVGEPATPVRMLTVDGALCTDTPSMTDDAVVDALRYMTLARTFDDRATSLQRQGRFGTFSSVRGQEASVVGAASTLDPSKDWIVPQYRELPALLRHGLPLENFARYFMGNPAGTAIPDGVRTLPIQISLAAQLPQAVGLAWGLRRQGGDGVVLTYFGDGASSEGDFHESLNLAGVTGAPTVFFLQNNGWAISTPRAAQTAAPTLAGRASGYGVEGVVVDGNDLLAVHQVTAEAVDRARAGAGPTLIESLTWRAGAHNTADDPTRYVDPGVAEEWSERDPVTRVQRYLRARGVLDDTGFDRLAAQCAAEVERALAVASETPTACAESLFDHVYASPPPRVVQQRAAWTARQEGAI